MKIAVCEDEKIFAHHLSECVEKYFSERRYEIHISFFTDGGPLVEALREGERFDIIFQDIQLESTDGMDTAALVRELDRHAAIIFVTGLEDRAVEGYAVSAFDYIIKSSVEARLPKVLDRFLKEYQQEIIKLPLQNGETRILSAADILWIESDGRTASAETTEGRTEVNIPITRLAAMLPEGMFTEVHKSVFVQTVKIKNIGTDTVEMCNGRQLPLSRRKRKTVMSAVMEAIK